jgi:hypothetical protein
MGGAFVLLQESSGEIGVSLLEPRDLGWSRQKRTFATTEGAAAHLRMLLGAA